MVPDPSRREISEKEAPEMLISRTALFESGVMRDKWLRWMLEKVVGFVIVEVSDSFTVNWSMVRWECV